MKIVVLFLFFLSANLFSQDTFEVQVDPSRPIKGESFQLIFKIQTQSSEEPYISFDPGRAQVLSKSEFSVSQSYSIINGVASQKRELTQVYELLANTEGMLTLKNINVDIGNKTLKKKFLRFAVSGAAKTLSNLFVIAEPSTTQAYVGEGITVNYYVYSRYQLYRQDIIKKFPKLNGFLSRFHNPREALKKAMYGGREYYKSLQYTSQVFPTKEGTLYLDPITVEVNYADPSSNRQGFGGLFTRPKKKSLTSTRVEIKVMPLPLEGRPSNFSGLVGEHRFKLKSFGTKFLVNQPIEFELSVDGLGQLENYDGPQLLNHPDLEAFDNKQEFKEISTVRAEKKFNYIYLARAPLKLAEQKLKLSYFDPHSKIYVEKELLIPALTVGGSAVASSGSSNKSSNQMSEQLAPQKNTKQASLDYASRGFLGPHLDSLKPINWIKYVNYIFILFTILLFLSFFHFKKVKALDSLHDLWLQLKFSKLSYSKIYQFFNEYRKKSNLEHVTIEDAILKSSIEKKDKQYFIDLITKIDREYSKKLDSKDKIRLNAKAFKNLIKSTKKYEANQELR